MSVARLNTIVERVVPILFDQIEGGRVPVQSEALLQLHLGRIIMTVADLEVTSPRKTFVLELEKPLGGGGRGGLGVWFRRTTDDGRRTRVAMHAVAARG